MIKCKHQKMEPFGPCNDSHLVCDLTGKVITGKITWKDTPKGREVKIGPMTCETCKKKEKEIIHD